MPVIPNVRNFKGHSTWIAAIDAHPSSGLFVTGSWDHTVRLWDIATGRERQVFHGHTQPVLAITIDTSGSTVASSGWDGTVRLWDIQSGQPTHVLRGHQDRVSRLTWSNDAKLIASASWDSTIRIWDTRTGHAVHVLAKHNRMTISLFFADHDRTLVELGNDYIVRYWDVETLRLLDTVEGDWLYHASMLVISPNGRLMANDNISHDVVIWDIASKQPVLVLPGHTTLLHALIFYDNDTLVSTSADGTIKAWDVRSGACIGSVGVPRQYEGMNLHGALGLSAAQRAALLSLGATE